MPIRLNIYTTNTQGALVGHRFALNKVKWTQYSEQQGLNALGRLKM